MRLDAASPPHTHAAPACRPRHSLAAAAVQGLSAPTLQSSLNYLLLALVYLPLHLRSQGWAWSFRRKWWAYALLALVDVQVGVGVCEGGGLPPMGSQTWACLPALPPVLPALTCLSACLPCRATISWCWPTATPP